MHDAPRPRRAGFFEAARTVLSAFFGVRKRTDHERESVHLSPVHIIIVGVVAAALFVLTLMVIVSNIVK